MYIFSDGSGQTIYPYSFNQLRKDNPEVSYPTQPTDAALASWGVFLVAETARPACDPNTHKVVEQTPQRVGDAWQQVWAVVALSAEEVAERERQVRAEIADQVQQRLDTFAQSRGYDNIVSACSYATSQHPKYGPEGRYCVQAREQTWDALFVIEADVIAGTRPMPAGYDDIESELPALVWPQ